MGSGMSEQPVAIVTGGAGGIGRAIAARLARDGYSVVAADRADALARLESATIARQPIDVTDSASVDAAIGAVLGLHGRIDVVVNCAGIMPMGPIADASLEAFDRVIATNLRGSFIVLAQAAQHVAQGGRIIMFSSSVVAKSFPGYGPYIASKAGVEGLVHVLANELRGREITVNAVAPGPVATELFLKGKSEAQVEQFRKIPPLERMGQPEDIADVVSFLAGPTGGWVNSQVIRANGGFA
jgi:3-oxoacyl-[acyl-carrier protein] reductase